MDLSDFPDINIDHLLEETPLEDGFLAPHRQVSTPHSQIPTPNVNARAREKRRRLAERIAHSDELIRQVKQLQDQNKQLADLQRTAQEVTDLYQKEKQQRLELQKESQQQSERCADLEKELDAQVINCESLQEKLETRALPVDANEVLGILMQLEQRLGDDAGLVRRDQIILKKLKDHCKTANISLPTPKSPPNPRNKRRSQATQTSPEPVPEKPTLCSVAVQVERLIDTRDQGTQHKNTTTTRGTTTASFIRKHDVGTSFPEPKPLPNVRQILDEMLSWRDAPLRPLSPLIDLLPEVEDIPSTVSVATCTTLCNIHREIDFLAELPPHIKVSASRPPSRTMFESVKEEARSSRELAKELLNFLPQNQSCLANLPPQAFEELWQVFGQMVLALLQRRSNPALATPPTVSQADFTSWLYELYEDTQAQPEQTSSASKSAAKRDFSTGTDPIVVSPNISHGGDVTPIRLPPKPRERKRKSKKREAAAALIKPVPKRKCREMGHPEDQKSTKEPEESEPETAIQFLSNLNAFNNENCDNLDMDLDEEEMYLLQLTSKATMQEEAEKGGDLQGVECENQLLALPAVQEESDSSLKYDIEEEDTEETENSDGITCKEAGNQTEEPEYVASLPDLSLEKSTACLQVEIKSMERENLPSLPDLCLEETYPLDPSSSSACMELEPEKKESFRWLPDLSPFSGSDSDRESTVCEEQLPNQEINSCKENPASPETHKYVYSSDSESDYEDNPIESVRETTCKGNQSKDVVAYLFGSDSDVESEASQEPVSKAETEWSPSESEEDFTKRLSESSESEDTELVAIESEEEFNEGKQRLEGTKCEEELSEKESESSEEQLSQEETEWSPIKSEEQLPIAYSNGIKERQATEQIPIDLQIFTATEDKPDGEEVVLPLISNISDLTLLVPDRENTDLVPSMPFLDILSSPSLNSNDDSEDDQKLVIVTSPSDASEDSLPSVTSKRRRTLSENKTPPTPGEGRLTRQRAKKLLMEQTASTESDISLAEQIRRQLKQAINKSGPLKRLCNLSVGQKSKRTEDSKPEQSHRSGEESPASPRAEPMEEKVDIILEIPLEQAVGVQDDKGQPKSILQHVIDQYKGDPKLSQLRRKTLGKPQQQLCASIGKYLKETLELESLSLEVYRLTKDEAVIVSAMIVVILKIGTEGTPLERLLDSLKNFNLTQRFLAELEERLFRNTQERPAPELAMKYVKLYLAAVSLQASLSQGYTNPVRLLLAKLLYHYDRDMPPVVLEVLRHFPTVLPHREQRDYDHSDPLITVIKHLLMSRTYDMQDPDGAERLLLSKLRFEYHFQPFEPNKEQVLENLVEKLKAGRSLEQLGYALALFCRRSPHIKSGELVVTEHLMPLAISYCDLAAQSESYDARIVVLLQCISMVLKPLPLETDISVFVGLVKRLIVAVPRPGVQQAAVQACLRLQRFGFQIIRDALQSYRPDYPLEPLTRAMIRCFAERHNQYRLQAIKGSGRK